MEALLPFDAKPDEVEKAGNKLYSILDLFNLRNAVEKTSYREMILNGIQGKSYTGQ